MHFMHKASRAPRSSSDPTEAYLRGALGPIITIIIIITIINIHMRRMAEV